MTPLLWALTAAQITCWPGVIWGLARRQIAGWLWYGTANVFAFTADLILHEYLLAGLHSAAVVLAIVMWGRRSRRRKRAAAWAGAKSRALIARLVRSLKPAPVRRLRPSLGGAR